MSDEAKLIVKLEATASKLVSEMKRGSEETRRRMKEIDDAFTGSNRKVTDGLGRAAKTYTEGAKAGKNYGFAIQNASYQVGDFAVQVAGGTSATRAFAQQLPQLLGGLGMFGAVAGAAAAIAIPLASNFLFAGEELKKIDAMSLDQVRGRVQELSDLQAKYNEIVAASGRYQSEATAETLSALDREYQAKLALFKLDAATLVQRQRQLEQSIQAQKDQVAALQAELNLFDDPDAAVADYTRTQSQATQLANLQEMIDKNQTLFDEIKRQNAELDLVNLSLSDAQGIISGAISLANGLTGALGAAGAAAQQIRIPSVSSLNYGKIMNTGESGPDAARREVMRQHPPPNTQPIYTFRVPDAKGSGAGRVGRGSGGGAGRAAEDPKKFLKDRLEAAQQAVEAAQVEAKSILQGAQAAAEAKAKLDLLSEAKRKNLDLDKASTKGGQTLRAEIDAQAAAIGRLTVEADRYKEQAQFMGQINDDLKNGMLDSIVAGESFAGVLSDIAKKFARAALEAALFNTGPMAGLFGGKGGGGSGGILGSLVGGLFGGGRERGGDVKAGTAYLVGEKRPEMFVPKSSGTIIPRVPTGGGHVTMTINVTGARGNAEIQDMVKSGVQQGMVMVKHEMPGWMASHQKRKA